jgi:hypothetical protein
MRQKEVIFLILVQMSTAFLAIEAQITQKNKTKLRISIMTMKIRLLTIKLNISMIKNRITNKRRKSMTPKEKNRKVVN